jgi:hypothetical protein
MIRQQVVLTDRDGASKWKSGQTELETIWCQLLLALPSASGRNHSHFHRFPSVKSHVLELANMAVSLAVVLGCGAEPPLLVNCSGFGAIWVFEAALNWLSNYLWKSSHHIVKWTENLLLFTLQDDLLLHRFYMAYNDLLLDSSSLTAASRNVICWISLKISSPNTWETCIISKSLCIFCLYVSITYAGICMHSIQSLCK